MTLLVNAYCTVRQPPELDFPHQPISRYDRNNPELGEHLNGLIGNVIHVNREMSQTRYAVLRHAERVQHQLNFEVEADQLHAMGAWARRANAILVMTNGAITDPAGRTLVDLLDGSASQGAQVPYPADAVARKQHHEAWLLSEQIPVASSLPPVLGEAELVLRSFPEVALRMMALTLVAIRAESLNGDNPIPSEEMRSRFPEAYNALTPNERAFMQNPAPDQQSIANHAWKYEAADTLRWALGRSESLPFASQICDVPATAGDLVQHGSDAILGSSALRPAAEILGQVDLHLRLHWATRQARADQVEPPRGLQASILQERRHALNWLIHFENADWDNVDTPT